MWKAAHVAGMHNAIFHSRDEPMYNVESQRGKEEATMTVCSLQNDAQVFVRK